MPGAPYIAGRKGARLVSVQSIWSRVNGQEFERRWWGTAADIAAIELSARAGATSVEFIQQPGSAIAILSARYSAATPHSEAEGAVETITKANKDESIPINRHINYIGIDPRRLRYWNEQAKEESPTLLADATAAELSYFALMQVESTHFRVKFPVITWTRTVGVGYSTSLDQENDGAIFSTNALANAIGAPILFSISTPTNIGVETATTGGVTPASFTAGWMKDSTLEYTSDGKIQLVITGEYGLWQNDLYDLIA